jgi:hypothetical protein
VLIVSGLIFILGYHLFLLTYEMAIVFVLNNEKTVDIFINTGEIKKYVRCIFFQSPELLVHI